MLTEMAEHRPDAAGDPIAQSRRFVPSGVAFTGRPDWGAGSVFPRRDFPETDKTPFDGPVPFRSPCSHQTFERLFRGAN